MTTLETLVVVLAVYGVVFLAHRASQHGAIDSIDVRWPDKDATVQSFGSVVANQLVDLSESDDKVKYAAPR